MRVAIVAPHYPEYTLAYARGLADHCDVVVCVDDGQVAAEYAGRTLPSHERLEIRRVRFKTPLDLARIFFFALRRRPAIVHLQEAVGPRRGFFSACIASIASRLATVVLTIHDPVPHSGNDETAARRLRHLRDYVRRLARIVIVHGDFCATQYRTVGPPHGQRLIVSDHGTLLHPDPRQVVDRPRVAARIRLLFFGRMEAYKGVEVVCAAAELLHRRGIAFELIVAGAGDELVRLGPRFETLPEVEIRRGFIPPDDLIDAIQSVDVVLLPYLGASQSGVAAASFGNGRPVIASRTGGLVDVVEPGVNGLLVSPGDPEALADAVQSLAQDTVLRATLTQGAQRTADIQLNWVRISGTIYDVFVGHSRTRRGFAQDANR